MPKSAKGKRRDEYLDFSEAELREALYAYFKQAQSESRILPAEAKKYIDHCDAVKRSHGLDTDD